MLKKTDIALAIFFIIISVSAIFFAPRSAAADEVVVSLDGEVYGTYNLEENLEVEIHSDEGNNILEIKNGQVRMKESDCPGGDCLRQAPINAESGGLILCLPHRLSIKVQRSGAGSQLGGESESKEPDAFSY